jgi:hypothetical protein
MRRLLALLLIPLAVVLPAVAAWSAWAYAAATDADAFRPAARSLADDVAVQRAVADRLVDIADERLAASPVPGDPAVVRARVRSIADELVRSAAYRAALREVLRTTHRQMAERLAGPSDSAVRLDTRPIATLLRDRLTAAGLGPIAAQIAAPRPITIVTRSDVRRGQAGADIARITRAVALPGGLLALVGVVLTARRRSTGLLRAALCVLAAIGLGAIAWGIAREIIGGSVAVAVFDAVSRPLRGWAVGGAVAAAVLAAAAAALEASRHRAQRSARHPWPLPRP